MRVLIVEDNCELARAMRDAFGRRHVHADIASSAVDAEVMIRTTAYALVILDLGLPDEDGLALLRRLRAARCGEPVVVVTARAAVESRIEGLSAGADDYVTKPFHFEELYARVQALLRRDGGGYDRSVVAASLSLHPDTRAFAIDGRPVDLPLREGELLEWLMRRFGRVVPKRMLEDQLFGSGDTLGSNAVEVYVHRLRKRLETEDAGLTIQTVRGVGYMLLAA
ncbi:response regulator transcription factor [Sphingomonas sp. SUN019]|uniref:response regulator n=1 Tax=Sphingomonas sp. SUN019 TaxID=2937788 RepID=UPI0021647A87|nr:response regulator transcription factor [Sphingomonas sp. SUN019]UVO50706.1 response regulator transcription factor [Sphingomonas sp. SUN019]